MRRALVIDDDVCIHDLAALALERSGWEVLTALTGVEGIRLALRSTPDLILLDIHMPQMDGPAILTELRTHSELCNVAVIFLTAESAVERVNLGESTAAGFIAKPFDPNTLGEHIEDMLRR